MLPLVIHHIIVPSGYSKEFPAKYLFLVQATTARKRQRKSKIENRGQPTLSLHQSTSLDRSVTGRKIIVHQKRAIIKVVFSKKTLQKHSHPKENFAKWVNQYCYRIFFLSSALEVLLSCVSFSCCKKIIFFSIRHISTILFKLQNLFSLTDVTSS